MAIDLQAILNQVQEKAKLEAVSAAVTPPKITFQLDPFKDIHKTDCERLARIATVFFKEEVKVSDLAGAGTSRFNRKLLSLMIEVSYGVFCQPVGAGK